MCSSVRRVKEEDGLGLLCKILAPFDSFHNKAFAAGELDAKIKEIIAITAAVTSNNQANARLHLEQAIDSGCTPEELKEIFLIILAVNGSNSALLIGSLIEHAETLFYEKWL